MEPTGENLEVVYDGNGNYLLVLGDKGIELDQDDAEILLWNLSHAMQDTFNRQKAESEIDDQ